MKLLLSRTFPLLLICCLVAFYFDTPVSAEDKKDVTSAVGKARDAGVPESLLNRMLAFGYKYKLRESEMANFVRITEDAKKEDLPIAPLVSKIEEGLAKRVQPQIIQRVLKRELSQYRFARNIAFETINRWGVPKERLKSEELVRLSKTLSMGISEQEMKGFFARVPKAPLSEIVDAVELKAALKQSRMHPEIAEEIVFDGLRGGFFVKTAWKLPLMVDSAKSHKVSDAKIKAAVQEVIRGKKSVMEAHIGLGLDPNDLTRGPQISGPGVASAGQGHGATTGHGGSGGAVGPAGSPGGSGSGDSGSGGPGSGGGPGGSGPGGGSGGGGSH
jgi:hypothetical protein